jgi:small subunit ribosomal protein S4
MARYTGPACRVCRREGVKLFLKGQRCLSAKCPFERGHDYPPGEHGRVSQFRRRRRSSDYLRQLREKQKTRRMYGVLERQFRRYFREAERERGQTGENLMVLLERRLDNVVYRLGFADSRRQARQLVQHGHFMINGRRTNTPSYLVQPQDVVAVREGSRGRTYFKERAKQLEEGSAPNWLSLDIRAMAGRMLEMPSRDGVEVALDEHLVVEFYSR